MRNFTNWSTLQNWNNRILDRFHRIANFDHGLLNLIKITTIDSKGANILNTFRWITRLFTSNLIESPFSTTTDSISNKLSTLDNSATNSFHSLNSQMTNLRNSISNEFNQAASCSSKCQADIPHRTCHEFSSRSQSFTDTRSSTLDQTTKSTDYIGNALTDHLSSTD